MSFWDHPLARGMDIDAPETTELRREIIRRKPFLQAVYRDWYRSIAQALPAGEQPVLEIGAGAGFLQEVVPRAIRSDIMPLSELDVVLDACRLPFQSGVLRGIVMTNVLPHTIMSAMTAAMAMERRDCIQPQDRKVREA